jgi:outer membrane protein OmpA-like peptidoglycan-associated protein
VLEKSIADADATDVDLLAPKSFSSAKSSLKDGLNAAESNDVKSANNYAREGQKSIAQANTDADRARDILDDVLVARSQAYDVGAKTLYPDELKTQEKKLKDIGGLVERNKIEEAKRARPKLKDAYLALELKSVKEGTTQLAEVAVNNAKKYGAEELAPKTFAKAKEQLALGRSTLDADRTQVDKADAYAKQATIFAERSAAIAELVKDFKRRNYTTEDIVVWHQNGLSTVSEPLGLALQFAESNETTINIVQTAISNLKNENNNNAQLAQNRSDELASIQHESATKLQSMQLSLKQQEAAKAEELARMQQKRDAEMQSMQLGFKEQAAAKDDAQQILIRNRKMMEDKFALTQGMFNPKEANVYRMRNDVLLSVHGFAFAPGKSEISTENFALLDKIKRSIAEFGGATVVVSGYTDSTGSAALNQTLSQQRAENVAKFLTEVGGIDPIRVSTIGYGEEKPVANNKTPEGRAQNRRIDILIKTQ